MAYGAPKSGGSGNFIKWDDEPKVIEGRLRNFIHGMYEGKPTIQAALVGADGVVRTIKISTGLGSAGFLEEPLGSQVEVTYEGKGRTANGKPFNKLSYRVDTSVGTTIPPTPEPAKVQQPVQQPVAAPSQADAIAAAKALLASLGIAEPAPQAPAPVSEYDKDFAILAAHNPKGAAAIKGALEQLYGDDPEMKHQKLKETMKQQGITS